MAARRNENRAFHEFVQVGTADTAPSNIDADSTRSDGWLGNVFDADVAFVVKTCCFHCNAPFLKWRPSEKTVNWGKGSSVACEVFLLICFMFVILLLIIWKWFVFAQIKVCK